MKYTVNTNRNVKSNFIEEDYFPAILSFTLDDMNNHFIEYKYDNTDMFEIIIDSNNNTLKQITLTLCHHYIIESENLDIPLAIEGELTIHDYSSIICDKFEMHVYKNGIKINISNLEATKFIKCDKLILAIDSHNHLVSLYMINLSPSNIQHILFEINHD